jgi:hypothetical protein
MLTGMPLVDPLPSNPRVRYLPKPVMPEQLYAVVRELLGGRGPSRLQLHRGGPGASPG